MIPIFCESTRNASVLAWMKSSTASPQTYDAWVAGTLPFDSPEIQRAFTMTADIWFDDAYVYGGRKKIMTEPFYVSPSHLFDQPPGCYMHKQSSFVLQFFPEDAVFGEDYDFFYLPPVDPQFGKPVLGAGDMLAMINDRPEVRQVMRYLATAESVRYFVEEGGIIAPHKDTPFEWYASPAQLELAQIFLEADTYRFDASDAMPAEVGTGAFWQGIIDWVNGEDLDVVLPAIDAAWPVRD